MKVIDLVKEKVTVTLPQGINHGCDNADSTLVYKNKNPLVSLYYRGASRFCEAVLLLKEAVCVLEGAALLLGW